MKIEKFELEVNTLKAFFELYCKDKHEHLESRKVKLEYKDSKIEVDLHLCKDCHDAINYSFDRLHGCPHEIKPRCRTCPSPCYEKDRWKNAAKVMKYSGVRLGLTKVKQKVKSLFS